MSLLPFILFPFSVPEMSQVVSPGAHALWQPITQVMIYAATPRCGLVGLMPRLQGWQRIYTCRAPSLQSFHPGCSSPDS